MTAFRIPESVLSQQHVPVDILVIFRHKKDDQGEVEKSDLGVPLMCMELWCCFLDHRTNRLMLRHQEIESVARGFTEDMCLYVEHPLETIDTGEDHPFDVHNRLAQEQSRKGLDRLPGDWAVNLESGRLVQLTGMDLDDMLAINVLDTDQNGFDLGIHGFPVDQGDISPRQARRDVAHRLASANPNANDWFLIDSA